MVAIFLYIVDLDDQGLDALGALKVFKILKLNPYNPFLFIVFYVNYLLVSYKPKEIDDAGGRRFHPIRKEQDRSCQDAFDDAILSDYIFFRLRASKE